MISTRLSLLVNRQQSLHTSLRRQAFSSECASKLKEAFEEYRKVHFSRETPSRFRKELVKSVEHDGVVEKDGLNQILINIGRQDRLLSDEEYQMLCKEAGDAGTLSTSNMMKLF